MNLSHLENRINNFIYSPSSKNLLYELLLECIQESSLDALHLVIMLAESDYDNFTYNFELKYSAVATALFWEEKGIEKLSTMVIAKQKAKDVKMVCEVLSYAIKGKLNELPFIQSEIALFKIIDFKNDKYLSQVFQGKAKEQLINILVNLKNDIALPVSVFNSILSSNL